MEDEEWRMKDEKWRMKDEGRQELRRIITDIHPSALIFHP